MIIVLFFLLSPIANCPCECDGKFNKLEQITKYKGLRSLHPRRPRGSQSGREKRRNESFHYGRKSPWVPDHFQKFKRMPAPDWAQKMLCIIVPNRRTVSPEFFSWPRTRRLLSRHTCPVRSPSFRVPGKLLFYTFLTRNKGTTEELKKRLGYYQQRAIEFAPRIFCFWRITIKMRRRWEIQISNSLTRQNNNFARTSRFSVHFFAVNCTSTRENA